MQLTKQFLAPYSQVSSSRWRCNEWWREKKFVLSWNAPLVVRLCRLVAGGRDQRCVRIFYNAVRTKIWETTLHKLVGIDDYLLLPESSFHSASEGEKKKNI